MPASNGEYRCDDCGAVGPEPECPACRHRPRRALVKPARNSFFDRFDICEAYFVLEMEWNTGGHIPERTAKRHRKESIGVQLDRMHFRPSPMLGSRDDLNENAREIYDAAVARYFPGRCAQCGCLHDVKDCEQ